MSRERNTPPADIQQMLDACEWLEPFAPEFNKTYVEDGVTFYQYLTNDGCTLEAWHTENGPYFEL